VPPGEFSTVTTRIGRFAVVMLRGELDGGAAPELGRALEGLAAFEGPLVVDLSELTFIDSGGLHALMQRAATDRARMCLVCPEGNVSRVLEIVQIGQLLPVYRELDDALAALS
jgi:anti-anti-sigma factor